MPSARQLSWFDRRSVSLARLLAIGALIAIAYYLVVRALLGPLNADERFFAHVVWLIDQGYDPYVDFRHAHLPLYFSGVAALVDARHGLDFVYELRALSALVVPVYAALLWRLLPREERIGGLALLGGWLVLARMVEIRPDTFGLLLMNAGWAVALLSPRRRHLVLACCLAAAALLFSARASVVLLGFGVTLALTLRHDARTLALLAGLGACLVAMMIAAAALLGPLPVVLRAVFIDASALTASVPISVRLFTPDRLLLVILVGAALAVAPWREREGLIIKGAAVTQLALILIDPSPFEYVYGWAAVPVTVGLLRFAPAPLRLLGPIMPAAFVFGMWSAYHLLKGREPPSGSSLRMVLDRPATGLNRLSEPALVELMISGRGQHSLAAQLAVRGEVCRRLPGTVLSLFSSHPVCLPDAHANWTEIYWSNADFVSTFARCPPRLFIWKRQWDRPTVTGYEFPDLSGYARFDGFAIAPVTRAGPLCRSEETAKSD